MTELPIQIDNGKDYVACPRAGWPFTQRRVRPRVAYCGLKCDYFKGVRLGILLCRAEKRDNSYGTI